MKNTGVVRKVDELGRIVIPSEIRNKFQIEEHSELEIFVDEGNIVLKKINNKECPLCHKACNKNDKYCSNCGFEFN